MTPALKIITFYFDNVNLNLKNWKSFNGHQNVDQSQQKAKWFLDIVKEFLIQDIY